MTLTFNGLLTLVVVTAIGNIVSGLVNAFVVTWLVTKVKEVKENGKVVKKYIET